MVLPSHGFPEEKYINMKRGINLPLHRHVSCLFLPFTRKGSGVPSFACYTRFPTIKQLNLQDDGPWHVSPSKLHGYSMSLPPLVTAGSTSSYMPWVDSTISSRVMSWSLPTKSLSSVRNSMQ